MQEKKGNSQSVNAVIYMDKICEEISTVLNALTKNFTNIKSGRLIKKIDLILNY